MAKEKSLVEEAIIQMKNLEEAVAENAKGILASTMKEEIKELVKESLSEQEEDDMEIDTDVEMEEPEMDDMEGDEMDTDNIELDMDMDDEEMDMDDEEDTIDLTNVEDDDEILRVFSLASPDDNIVVVKDGAGNINLKDDDKEYMIVGEGDEDDYSGDMDEEWYEMYNNEEDDESIDDIVEKVFMNNEEEMDEMEDMEEEMDEMEDTEEDEIVYEIEMDEEDVEEGDVEDLEDVMESKMSVKPKGMGMGSPNKRKMYSNKPNMEGGFKTIKKKVNKTMGTGKAKFEYKEGENLEGKMKPVKKTDNTKKMETKEAARTYGNGSKSGRGLRKGITPNRNLNFESTADKEVEILREKNEEYRKALDVFRNKLNEVAVFNSNLAYATRLFTEHSTSKQEKINILRRFDGVETLKESKNLYKIIKDELSVKTSKPMNESIERKIENVQVSGSAVNLIESKTYENPQFLRMKDLMSKLK